MHTPRRAEIADAEARTIKAGRWYKADIYAVDLGYGEIAIKDFAAKPLPIRVIGRMQIAHECRAYEWVGAAAGVPEYHGRVDANALAVECVDGQELISSPERFSSRLDHLHSLHEVFNHFLSRGFLHLDSRGRHNVMLRSDGQVMAIDLAGSFWLAPGSLGYRMLRPCLMGFYGTVLSKWRKLLSPGRAGRDEKVGVAKLLMWLRMPHKLFKR